VDGLRLGFWREDFIKEVQIDPGIRELTVYCEYTGFPLCGYIETNLTATLLAGHAYQLQCERTGRYPTLWVEDAATKEPASEKKQVKAHVYVPMGSPVP
jgi:hypothetical protein